MIYCGSFNGRKGVVDLSVSAGKVYLERLIYLITSGSQKAERRALGAIQAKLYDIFSLSFSDIYMRNNSCHFLPSLFRLAYYENGALGNVFFSHI